MPKDGNNSPSRRHSASPKRRVSTRTEECGQSSEKKRRLDEIANASPVSISPPPLRSKHSSRRSDGHSSSRSRKEKETESRHKRGEIQEQTENNGKRKRSRHYEENSEKQSKRSKDDSSRRHRGVLYKNDEMLTVTKSPRKVSKTDKKMDSGDISSSPSLSKRPRNRDEEPSTGKDDRYRDNKGKIQLSRRSKSPRVSSPPKKHTPSASTRNRDRRPLVDTNLSKLLLEPLAVELISDDDLETLLPKSLLVNQLKAVPSNNNPPTSSKIDNGNVEGASKEKENEKAQLEDKVLSNLSQRLQEKSSKAESWEDDLGVEIDFDELFSDLAEEAKSAMNLACTVKPSRNSTTRLLVLPWQDLLVSNEEDDGDSVRKSSEVAHDLPVGLAALAAAGVSRRYLGDRLASELEDRGLHLPAKFEFPEDASPSVILDELSWRKSLLGIWSTI